jgi:hypothetical protein
MFIALELASPWPRSIRGRAGPTSTSGRSRRRALAAPQEVNTDDPTEHCSMNSTSLPEPPRHMCEAIGAIVQPRIWLAQCEPTRGGPNHSRPAQCLSQWKPHGRRNRRTTSAINLGAGGLEPDPRQHLNHQGDVGPEHADRHPHIDAGARGRRRAVGAPRVVRDGPHVGDLRFVGPPRRARRVLDAVVQVPLGPGVAGDAAVGVALEAQVGEDEV